METNIEIPNGVSVKKEGDFLIVSGSNGTIKKKFLHPMLSLNVEGDKVIIKTKIEKKKLKSIFNSWVAHVKNMIKGVQNDWEYKLKIVYAHFPIMVKQEGNYLLIEGFFGEKKPRKAKIMPNVKLKLSKTEIVVSGPDLEAVGQTAANIEQATRITNRDRRRFQDGIYIVKKPKWVVQ